MCNNDNRGTLPMVFLVVYIIAEGRINIMFEIKNTELNLVVSKIKKSVN